MPNVPRFAAVKALLAAGVLIPLAIALRFAIAPLLPPSDERGRDSRSHSRHEP